MRYESVHHGVYVDKALRGEDLPRAQAALLAVPGSALVLQSAAWLLTRGRVDLPARVELRVPATRQVRRAGLVAYPGLLEKEVDHCRGLRVTSGAQTAIDIACRLPRRPALEAIDALCNTERCTVLEIADLLHRYAGRRGVVRARSLLPEIEPGAESCRETKTRLIMIDGGLRRPLANVAVLDAVGGWLAWADLLYRELWLIIEYQGGNHLQRRRFRNDRRRIETLTREGYFVIEVTDEDLLNERALVARIVDAAIDHGATRGVSRADVLSLLLRCP